jgi:two-component system, NarL family, invasion response regulator UvrY
MIRVLIADDHAIVRKGFLQIVNETPDMRVVGEASNGQEILEKVRELDCDVLVLDISMPRFSGLESLREIRYLRPDLPVLILSMHSEDQYAIRSLKAGAAGYLNKETAIDELVVAIRKVVSGGKYLSVTAAEKIALEIGNNSEKAPHERLSNREYSVLLMIGSGKSISEIADELSLSVKTVSTYRTRILEKMGLNTNADLIRYVIENDLS